VESLFVEPNDAEKALVIFRRLNRVSRLYGASVINTMKVQTWTTKVKKNSCASLISSDNPIIEKFLQRILKNLICVDTEKELMTQEMAVTNDGLLYKYGTFEPVKFRQNLLLGKHARERTIEMLEEQMAKDAPEIESARQAVSQTDKLKEALAVVRDKIYGWSNTSELKGVLLTSESDLKEKTDQKGAIDLGHLEEIREKHKAACNKVKSMDQALRGLTGDISSRKTEHQGNTLLLEEIIERVDFYAEAREAIESNDVFDSDAASEKESELLKQFKDEVDILNAARKRTTHLRTSAENSERNGLNAMRDYCARYKIEPPKDNTPTKALWEWVKTNAEKLEATDLANHQDAARKALADAEVAFRTDVALELRQNIENMKLLIGELNRSLKTRPFSGGEIYQFEYSVNSEYRDIIKFVEQASLDSQASVGSLLDNDRGFTDGLIERIKTDKAEIADYRNYYSYEITIKSKSGTTSRLSKRLGVASGGENRTPYYISIGASMASAYRINNQIDLHDGVGLIPLDEPFEKMDGPNLTQAMNYLKDVGLQMIIAAPSDQQIKLSPLVNTVIFLARDGENLSSSVTYLKDKASKLLLSDNLTAKDKEAEAIPA